jgi:hypothetical protein
MAKNDKLNMKNDLSQEQVKLMAQALMNAESVQCKCGNSTFIEGFKLKKMSRLLTGDTQDRILPIPSVICSKCHEELNPEKQEENKDVITLDFKNKK